MEKKHDAFGKAEFRPAASTAPWHKRPRQLYVGGDVVIITEVPGACSSGSCQESQAYSDHEN